MPMYERPDGTRYSTEEEKSVAKTEQLIKDKQQELGLEVSSCIKDTLAATIPDTITNEGE